MKEISTVELLAIINRHKQEGRTLDEIIAIMERMGLHRDNTIDFYEMLV